MSGTTVIRRADWVVAWSEEKSGHVYLRDADVVFQGTEVLSIGEHYDGEVETEIDGGRVVISARAETDESVCIQVEDNGIGIAAQDMKKIFEPFGQVQSKPDRPHEGTGLGLSFSRSLTELNGSQLRLTSETGKGTCVSIQFPPEKVVPEKSDPAAGKTA